MINADYASLSRQLMNQRLHLYPRSEHLKSSLHHVERHYTSILHTRDELVIASFSLAVGLFQ